MPPDYQIGGFEAIPGIGASGCQKTQLAEPEA
jgi:hypothetical protein